MKELRHYFALKDSKSAFECAPSPAIGQDIPDKEFKAFLQFYCALPTHATCKTCPRRNCNAELDRHGDHLLKCMHGISPSNSPRHVWHDAIKYAINRTFANAGYKSHIERPITKGCTPDVSIEINDDEFLHVDVAIVCQDSWPGKAKGYEASNKELHISHARTLRKTYQTKLNHYRKLLANTEDPGRIVPVVIDARTGAWETRSKELFHHLSNKVAGREREKADKTQRDIFLRATALSVTMLAKCLYEGVGFPNC